MAVYFLWKQSLEINLNFTKSLVELVTIVTVFNIVIGGVSWEDFKWLAHVTVRLQVSDYSQLSDYNFAD